MWRRNSARQETVVSNAYLFHGVVQHGLYHGGQVAMLKKALSRD